MKKYIFAALSAGALFSPISSHQAIAAEQAAPVEAKAHNQSGNSNTIEEIDRPGMFDRMTFKLSLSKEQKEKIHAIRSAKLQKSEEIHKEQKAKLASLQNALKSGSDDDVRKAFEELQGVNQKLSAIHLEGMLETRALLTPDQRKIFSGMSMHVLGGHKRGRHGGK